jgi:hypothetical protein
MVGATRGEGEFSVQLSLAGRRQRKRIAGRCVNAYRHLAGFKLQLLACGAAGDGTRPLGQAGLTKVVQRYTESIETSLILHVSNPELCQKKTTKDERRWKTEIPSQRR